jgi:hypothetical protein
MTKTAYIPARKVAAESSYKMRLQIVGKVRHHTSFQHAITKCHTSF